MYFVIFQLTQDQIICRISSDAMHCLVVHSSIESVIGRMRRREEDVAKETKNGHISETCTNLDSQFDPKLNNTEWTVVDNRFRNIRISELASSKLI